MVACRTASAEGTLAVAVDVDVDLPDERAGDEDAMMSPVRWKPSSSKTAAPWTTPRASCPPFQGRWAGTNARRRSGQLIVHCWLVWPFRPAQRFEAAPTRATPLVPGVPWTRSRRCRARCCRRPPRSARCRGLGLVRQCGHSPVGRGRTCRREGDHGRVLTVDPDGRLTTPIWLVLTATGSAGQGCRRSVVGQSRQAGQGETEGEDARGDASRPAECGDVRHGGAFRGQYPTRKVASCFSVVVETGSIRRT
ncbi:hypothetical protein QFZ32_008907 [Streptomyces canus]|nr:hypothetical protein [Streptomyces canus]